MSKKGTLVISRDQYVRPNKGAVSRIRLSAPSLSNFMPPHLAKHGIEFIHLGSSSFEPPEFMDGQVLFCLLFAMQHFKEIVVDGSVSEDLVRNAMLLQEIWSCWRPEKYSVVPISATNVFSSRSDQSSVAAWNTIMPFSGGLDSVFTLLRNTRNEPGRFSVKSVVTALGFDMHLSRREEFKKLVRRIEPVLNDAGVSHRLVSVNSREFGDFMNWEDSHGLQIASILHQFSREFSTALIASSWSANDINIPWGSTAITDHLMSGSGFRITSDGDGFSRMNKILAVSNNEEAMRSIKVCWQGKDLSRNCGICGKCVRTRIRFAVAGFLTPPCFDQPFDPDIIDLAETGTNLSSTITFLADTVRFAKRHGRASAWINRLEVKLKKLRQKMLVNTKK